MQDEDFRDEPDPGVEPLDAVDEEAGVEPLNPVDEDAGVEPLDPEDEAVLEELEEEWEDEEGYAGDA